MIVDFHTHVFPPEVIARREEFISRDAWLEELYGNPKAKMATVDDLLASMERDGVDVSVTFPFGWRDPGLAEECNSYVIQAMRDHPGRIIGLASVQPLAGARALAPLVEAAQQLGLFALTHASEPVGHLYQGKGDVTPPELQAFIQAFPALRVVAAHWGGGFPFYELMPEVQAAAANVWYDSAAPLYLYRSAIFPTVARIAGPEKILFGSDYPLISQRRMLDYARDSGLDERELALALGGNAARFLGMEAPTPDPSPVRGRGEADETSPPAPLP